MTDVAGQTTGQAQNTNFSALAVGQVVGRYEVVSILGQGGFGITYRARDTRLNREVALKEYLPSSLAVRQDGVTVLPRSTEVAEDFTWGRDRFVAEGQTLATLHQAPGIVRVFDFLEANGTAYIVMELLSGETLENRLKKGPLETAAIDRILSPLLDGLEQVHGAGFLHRDIKPANILLNAAGKPTLIDFGASRAAMAGRTTAMTAIFTPGYAAAEQFTSARQGPYTDIYALSATLYHAITGHVPPSAIDRMLEETYKPLSGTLKGTYPPGLLAGIDAGLRVKAADRPHSIADWRPILAGSVTPATMVPAKKRMGMPLLASGVLAALAVAAGGAYYFIPAKPPAAPQVAAAPQQPTELEKIRAAELKAEQEAARLKNEAEARQKAEAEALERQKMEAELRQRIEAEQAAKRRAEAEAAARQKAEQEEAQRRADAEAAAKQKALEADKGAAEAAENALKLSLLDRQHLQVALTSLGFNTNGSDGAFGPRTREMIAAWQKTHNRAATGFLQADQQQALLHDAAPAIAKYEEEQKKKADEDKAKVDAAAKPAPGAPAPAPPPASAPAATNVVIPAGPAPNGMWAGTMHCTESQFKGTPTGPEITFNLQVAVSGGTGTWLVPRAVPGTPGTKSVSLTFNGSSVTVSRSFEPNNPTGIQSFAKTTLSYSGNTISGTALERGAGRTCTISLTRTGS